MPPSSTISSKGQITLPLEIRQRLGLKEGDRVEFVVDHQRTIVRPARQEINPFEKYARVLPTSGSKSEMNAWVRSLRKEDVTSQ